MLKIGLAIDHLLRNDPNIYALVGGNIFPVGIPHAGENGENIKYPAIIYGRTSLDPEYTKGCGSQDDVVITVDCWAKSYKEAVEIASAVRMCLEELSGTFAGIRIQHSEMTGATEGFSLPDLQVQTLTFDIK